MTENDTPMGAHLRKFVLPRLNKPRALDPAPDPPVRAVVA